MDELADRSLSEWIEIAGETLRERGFAYGDPRHHLLRVYDICRILGVQFRDPSQLALVFIAVKLSRLVESPMREDSIVDLIGYSAILGQLRFTDWNDFDPTA
jgi:hypothetical protein